MNDDVRIWLEYAEENLRSARVLFEDGLLNPCLQNAQQAVEKALKAMLIARGQPLRRTHSIFELVTLLSTLGISADITEEECNLFDSIYLPSKYPLGSALPSFIPSEDLCNECLNAAVRILAQAMRVCAIGD